MPRIDYATMSPVDLLAAVVREGASGPAARVAESLLRPPQPPPSLRCSADVYARLRPDFAGLEHERFAVAAVDSRNRMIQIHVIAQGSLATCTVHPRDVFRALLTGRKSPAACILVHNHPSGDPGPSPEDCTLTARLVDAGKLLGVQVLDHIVIGSDGYYSFRDRGCLIGETGRE